jgi:hypothetical protein
MKDAVQPKYHRIIPLICHHFPMDLNLAYCLRGHAETMDQDLQRYINDHLAGSQGALTLIQDLAGRQDDPQEKEFFLQLRSKVEDDQRVLKQLLSLSGLEESALLQVAGSITGKVGRIKLFWEGMDPGRLGMFEALEMLALGIQGKRLLWVVLQEIAPHFPEWKGINFAELEFEAIRQRENVEERRIERGREALTSVERRRKVAMAS